MKHIWPAVFVVAAGCGGQADASESGFERAFGEPVATPIPAGAERVYDALLAACREGDAPALWSTMAPSLRAEVDALAAAALTGLTDAQLRARYGYRGHRIGFDGTALLQGLLATRGPAHPCPDADLWRRSDVGEIENDVVFVVDRPDRTHQAMRVGELDGRWCLFDLSLPRAPGEP